MSENDAAGPDNAVPLEEADLYRACKDFILLFALPALEPEGVLEGWQAAADLPAEDQGYAVMRALSGERQGTIVEGFNAPDPDPSVAGRLSLRGLYKIGVRLDFCAPDDLSRQRAQRAALAGNSQTGVDFFQRRGFSLLYADDVREESYPEEARRRVRRYFTTLYLSVWSGLDLDQDYFDRVSLSRIQNVEA